MKLRNLIYTILVIGIFGIYWFWPKPEYQKTTEMHIAHSGETVWTIAEYYFSQQNKYKYFLEFVHEVRSENKHLGKYLQPGDVVYIPLEVEKN